MLSYESYLDIHFHFQSSCQTSYLNPIPTDLLCELCWGCGNVMVMFLREFQSNPIPRKNTDLRTLNGMWRWDQKHQCNIINTNEEWGFWLLVASTVFLTALMRTLHSCGVYCQNTKCCGTRGGGGPAEIISGVLIKNTMRRFHPWQVSAKCLSQNLCGLEMLHLQQLLFG